MQYSSPQHLSSDFKVEFDHTPTSTSSIANTKINLKENNLWNDCFVKVVN